MSVVNAYLPAIWDERFPPPMGDGRMGAFQPGDFTSGCWFFRAHRRDEPDQTADALGDVGLFCVAALSLPALFVARAVDARTGRAVATSLIGGWAKRRKCVYVSLCRSGGRAQTTHR
jgi:hypothetical protein